MLFIDLCPVELKQNIFIDFAKKYKFARNDSSAITQ